jgi:hypothetical protein
LKQKLPTPGEYKTRAMTTTAGWKPQTQKLINKSRAERGLAGAGLPIAFYLPSYSLAVTMSRVAGMKQREKTNPQKGVALRSFAGAP